MEKIESGDEKILQTWNEYLDYLAVLISNLRMAYDMDIILGGDVGGVLSDYMIPLGEKVILSIFSINASSDCLLSCVSTLAAQYASAHPDLPQ